MANADSASSLLDGSILADLSLELEDLVHWKTVGCYLNLPVYKLDEIDMDHKKCNRAMIEMLDYLMKTTTYTKEKLLSELIRALYVAGESELAGRLETKYGDPLLLLLFWLGN